MRRLAAHTGSWAGGQNHAKIRPSHAQGGGEYLKVHRFSEACSFLAAAEPWLSTAEVQNNVILGIARSVADGSRILKQPPYFAAAFEDDQITCCATRTPPHVVLVTRGAAASHHQQRLIDQIHVAGSVEVHQVEHAADGVPAGRSPVARLTQRAWLVAANMEGSTHGTNCLARNRAVHGG